MKTKIFGSSFLLMSSWFLCANADDLKNEFRVHPNGNTIRLICFAVNNSNVGHNVHRSLLYYSNHFQIVDLGDSNREMEIIAPHVILDSPEKELIPSGGNRKWITTDSDFDLIYSSAIYDKKTALKGTGSYQHIVWALNNQNSPQVILVGFVGVDGRIHQPVVAKESKSLQLNVGLVYHKNNPLGIVFLAFNGTADAVLIGNNFQHEIFIIASSPSINYRREIMLPESIAENIKVEAGKVGEWRLPWQTVLDLIPKEDLEKIKAGGGDLDLVWKVGEFQSDPLPLSLSDPEAQAEVKPPVLKPRLFFSSRHGEYTEPDQNENGSFTLATPPQIPKIPLGLRFPDGYLYFFRVHDVEEGTAVSDIPDPERTRVEFDFSEISPGLEANRTESNLMLMQDGYSDFAYTLFLPLAPKELFPLSVVPGRYRLYLVTREKDGTDQTRLVADFEATQGQEVQRIPLQWKSEAITFNDFHRSLLLSWPGKPSLD